MATKHVLVVEDDDTDFEFIAESLPDSFAAVRATNGDDAIAIMDGDYTGADLAEIISGEGIPVVLLSNAPSLAKLSSSGIRVEKGSTGTAAVIDWLRSLE